MGANTGATVHLRVQQIDVLVLAEIKTAANVDTVCFDKTGTLTGSAVSSSLCHVLCLP